MKGKNMKKRIYKGKALDLIQTINMDSHIPLVYCNMILDTSIDINRLKHAVSCTVKIVPQILCRYNYAQNTWIMTDYNSNSLITIVSEKNCYEDLIWDLCKGPQLKILIYHQENGDCLQIAMSHILTDGAGFVQYLALLCKFYNEKDFQDIKEINFRSVLPLLLHTAIHRLPHIGAKIDKGNILVTLPAGLGQKMLYSSKVTLSEKQFERVQKSAKKLHVTLNDILMASYAYALRIITLQDKITLPCPADLRKFNKQNNKLTIANMTGKYSCSLTLAKKDGLKDIALAVHNKMRQKKSRYDCFRNITFLHIIFEILPINVLRHVAKARYSFELTSYTNMGVIDEKKISFKETVIKECYLCGTYRHAPSFQISVSTYKNVCTLAANIYGTREQYLTGIRVLYEMKSILLKEI